MSKSLKGAQGRKEVPCWTGNTLHGGDLVNPLKGTSGEATTWEPFIGLRLVQEMKERDRGATRDSIISTGEQQGRNSTILVRDERFLLTTLIFDTLQFALKAFLLYIIYLVRKRYQLVVSNNMYPIHSLQSFPALNLIT